MWMFLTFLVFISIGFVKSTVDYLQHPVKSCRIGDVVENECNKCLCTSKTVFECTPVDCNKNKSHKKFEDTKQVCYPNQLYVQNLITCICTKDGRWPHKSCQDTFQSLDPSNVKKHKCEPNTYVPIDCNVCRCGPNGEINSERCTRNSCDEEIQRRANFRTNSVYSKCEVRNWYSLAPCQFCFCVNQNRLVCNTGNYYSQKFELGNYNLRVCGKDLIREAIELVSDKQKALKLDFLNNTTPTTMQRAESTPATTTQQVYATADQNTAIEVNQGSIKNINNEDKPTKLAESIEYYYYSEEESQKLQNQQNLQNSQTPRISKVLRNVQNLQKSQILNKPQTTPKPTKPATARQEPSAEAQGLDIKLPIGESDGMMIEDVEDDSNELNIELENSPSMPKIITSTDSVVQAFSSEKQMNALPKSLPRMSDSYHYVGNTLKINLPQVLSNVFQQVLRKSMVSLNTEAKCEPGSTVVNDCNMCFCLKNGKLLCTSNTCNGGVKDE